VLSPVTGLLSNSDGLTVIVTALKGRHLPQLFGQPGHPAQAIPLSPRAEFRALLQHVDPPHKLLIQLSWAKSPLLLTLVVLQRCSSGPACNSSPIPHSTPRVASRPGPVTLEKLSDPAIRPASLAQIDVVLLSHDHHYDNLDRAGRTLLAKAGRVLTTTAGAQRLMGNAVGLETWQSFAAPAVAGGNFTITATPARHGPAGRDRGPVCGFVVSYSEAPGVDIFISGDTVWYERVAEVAKRFNIATAVLFMGAAQVPAVPNSPLTMTAADAIEAALAFSRAAIIPLHYEGWAHFTESREQIAGSFERAGMQHRVLWLPPGKKVTV